MQPFKGKKPRNSHTMYIHRLNPSVKPNSADPKSALTDGSNGIRPRPFLDEGWVKAIMEI